VHWKLDIRDYPSMCVFPKLEPIYPVKIASKVEASALPKKENKDEKNDNLEEKTRLLI